MVTGRKNSPSFLVRTSIKPAMISAFALRNLLKCEPLAARQMRFISTPASSAVPMPSQRSIHSSVRREADVTADSPVSVMEEGKTSTLVNRFASTAEVTVSKIFPAGFGWQTASIVAADGFGYASDSAAFALSTGLGDALGVLMGHVTFYGIKKSIYDGSINMTKELHTGILLGSAAFCSGTVWQPIVDVLQGANLPFIQVFAGTWIGCGTAFYVGLRVGRTLLSGPLKYIEEPTFENSMNDKSLSAAIGGATAFFVGTDASYLPAQNFLIDIVGITEGTPNLTGCAIAGTSTSLGFATAQSTFNIVYPAGKCWND